LDVAMSRPLDGKGRRCMHALELGVAPVGWKPWLGLGRPTCLMGGGRGGCSISCALELGITPIG
jgi:hypothetical protein